MEVPHDGIAIPKRMATIADTTRSSVRVKPFWRFFMAAMYWRLKLSKPVLRHIRRPARQAAPGGLRTGSANAHNDRIRIWPVIF